MTGKHVMGRCLVAGAGWGTFFGVFLPMALMALSPGNALVEWEEVRFVSTAFAAPVLIMGLAGGAGAGLMLRRVLREPVDSRGGAPARAALGAAVGAVLPFSLTLLVGVLLDPPDSGDQRRLVPVAWLFMAALPAAAAAVLAALLTWRWVATLDSTRRVTRPWPTAGAMCALGVLLLNATATLVWMNGDPPPPEAREGGFEGALVVAGLITGIAVTLTGLARLAHSLTRPRTTA